MTVPPEPMPERRQAALGQYSRIVRWMKVALPVLALLLVGAIFLVGRSLSNAPSLLTAAEMAQLGAGLRLENPQFTGQTESGEPYVVRAAWAVPDSAMPEQVLLEAPDGEVILADGRRLTGRSDTGLMLRADERLRLDGNVRIETSDGYLFETARLVLHFGAHRAISPVAVTGTGPVGRIEAGSMRVIGQGEGTDGTRIFFDDRVRVVFMPQAAEAEPQ